MKKRQKILITDLDGTFVKDSRKVNKDDLAVMEALSKEMMIGVATGRSIKEISYIEKQINIDLDVRIGFNGAVVEVNGEIIYENSLNEQSLRQIMDYIQEKDLVFDALDGERRIGTHEEKDKTKLWNMKLVNPNDILEKIEDLKIYKINIRPYENQTNQILLELQQLFPYLAICKSGPSRIEITANDITKGNALEVLRKQVPVSVIAIGDSENDISMFQASQQSICMAHADKKVQKYAMEIVNNFHEILGLV